MTREQIKLGLKKCIEGNCATCPYREGKSCSKELKTDALNLILNLELELGKDLDCADAELWTRQRVLKEAEKCVCGQREQDYGTPEDSFQKIGTFWTAYLNYAVKIAAEDVAAMMALLKIARISENPQHMDNWVDGCGYFACGGEIAGGGTSMRITLDIPDGIICGFFNGVERTETGLQLVSYQLSSDDFMDGNTVKLPREREEGDEK